MTKQQLLSIVITFGISTAMFPSLTLAEEESVSYKPGDEDTYELEEGDIIAEENEEVNSVESEEIYEETVTDEGTEGPVEETLSEESGSQPDIDVHTPKTDDGIFHYIDENGNDHSTDAHLLEYVEDEPNSLLDDGWYIVTHDWTFNNRLVAVGDVRLILADGVTLTMNHGIRVEEGVGSLEIFAQSPDAEQAGKLYCGAYEYQAGIGGNEKCKNGEIIFHGGTIKAEGGAGAAGVGGGFDADGGVIQILGGTITTYGGSWGAGIGGGSCGNGGEVLISGGNIEAYGGSRWKGWNGAGAGIGGGKQRSGGTIVINGGSIIAKGNEDSAGIGGGFYGDSGYITINGGSIEANGNIAIGHGLDGNNNEIVLGNRVYAAGYPYARRYTALKNEKTICLSEEDVPVLEPVEYIHGNGTQGTISDYRDFGELVDEDNNILEEGWYVVYDSETFDSRPSVVGNVNIILTDGVELNMKHGFRVEDGLGTLTIYGQTLDESTAGKLICGAYDGQAAIGGNKETTNGRIVIESGTVNAYAGSDGAGIGAGSEADCGRVEILGGTVKAIGGNSWNGAGAGIGGGNHGGGGEIVISGGTIDAEGGNWAAGIGGGNRNFGGRIIINGGNIYAKGNNGGAGIGGGDEGQSGSITINVGTIEAHGHLAIGHGRNAESSDDTRLGDGIAVKNFDYEDRYNILAIAQDAWIEPMNSTLPEFTYIDADGKDKTLKDYRRLSTRPDMANDILDSGWYVVDKDAKFENRPTIQGEVNLLLCDGVTLNMVHGICNREGQTLNIYVQSNDGHMGKLICGSYDNQAGIGGNNNESNGTINIYGGHIEATGTHQGAGIGGGDSGNGGEINIYGGDVHAEACVRKELVTNGVGAGIGGGDNGCGGTVRIYGGKVFARSQENSLRFVYDNWGAGIGGGDSGNGGTIEIYGGNIEAHGHHAIGAGKDSDGSVNLTLGDAVNVDGVEYNDRYNVMSYAQEAWISPRKA